MRGWGGGDCCVGLTIPNETFRHVEWTDSERNEGVYTMFCSSENQEIDKRPVPNRLLSD